jgi:CheY-like chemotaxis protein
MADLSHLSRVLVVEDEALIMLDIESTLQDAGVAEIVATGSSAEALQQIEAGEFDAAVLDLHLGPNNWTYDIARQLMRRGIRFIFSSGTVEYAEGFRDVPLVPKPFSADQLIAALIQVTTGDRIQAAQ